MLNGKHIILGITGSIAAYKAAMLCRLLVKEGAEVRVIMTPLAKQFITPLTMATLSKHPILVEFFNPENGEWNSHVSLGEWADMLLIAPATANTLAKMTTGIADNLLLTTYLSARSKVAVAPAMDLDMYAHITTQQNLATLKERGVAIFELLNEAYSHLYGYSELSMEQIQQYIKSYLPLLDLRLVPIIVDKDDNLVGFGILLPSLAKAFQKAQGFMFPFGWWHLIKALKWNDTQTSEMLLVAVKPEYQGKGAVALIFEDIVPVHSKLGFKYSESNPELEVNTKMQSQWDYFERENHKRRRAYMKKI